MRKAAEVAKIVGLCIFASVVYGVLHDQITARVYLPYFTVWHPHLIDSDDPTTVAFFWGFVATWWVGLILSIPLSFAAVFGERPLLRFRTVALGVTVLLLANGACAALLGLASYSVGFQAPSFISGPDIPVADLRRFSAVLVAHNVSYMVGFFGGLALCGWIWFRRMKLARGAVV